MDRFKAHFRNIQRWDVNEDMGRHFNSSGHSGTADLTVHVLDFIYALERAGFALDLHLQVEFNWIETLKTMLPLGLNTMDKAPVAQFCRDIGVCASRNKIVEAKHCKSRQKETGQLVTTDAGHQ